MTFREAMREPMSLQAMLSLVIGYALGIGFSLATLIVFGTLMAEHPRPACPPTVDQVR